MQCEEWTDANSELCKEAHDEAVHKNSYKRKLYELISASLDTSRRELATCGRHPPIPLRGTPPQESVSRGSQVVL